MSISQCENDECDLYSKNMVGHPGLKVGFLFIYLFSLFISQEFQAEHLPGNNILVKT